MSVDDSGAHPLPHDPALDAIPTEARDARSALEIWDWHARKHPDMATDREAAFDAAAAELRDEASLDGRIPNRLLFALEHATEGGIPARHTIRVHGINVQVIASKEHAKDLSPTRRLQIWRALQHVVADINTQAPAACRGYSIHPGMPPEIAIATWDRDGHRVYACRPGSRGLLRATRRRITGLTLLTPVPVLAAVTQKLGELCAYPAVQTASAVAAVGVVATGTALPVIPASPVPPTRIQVQENTTTSQPSDPRVAPQTSRPSPSPAPGPTMSARRPTHAPPRPNSATEHTPTAPPTAQPSSPRPLAPAQPSWPSLPTFPAGPTSPETPTPQAPPSTPSLRPHPAPETPKITPRRHLPTPRPSWTLPGWPRKTTHTAWFFQR